MARTRTRTPKDKAQAQTPAWLTTIPPVGPREATHRGYLQIALTPAQRAALGVSAKVANRSMGRLVRDILIAQGIIPADTIAED